MIDQHEETIRNQGRIIAEQKRRIEALEKENSQLEHDLEATQGERNIAQGALDDLEIEYKALKKERNEYRQCLELIVRRNDVLTEQPLERKGVEFDILSNVLIKEQVLAKYASDSTAGGE